MAKRNHPLAALQNALNAQDKNAIKIAHRRLMGLCRDEQGAEIDWDNPDYQLARDYFLQTNP